MFKFLVPAIVVGALIAPSSASADLLKCSNSSAAYRQVTHDHRRFLNAWTPGVSCRFEWLHIRARGRVTPLIPTINLRLRTDYKGRYKADGCLSWHQLIAQPGPRWFVFFPGYVFDLCKHRMSFVWPVPK